MRPDALRSGIVGICSQYLYGDFTWISNWIYVENIQDHAYQRTLRTSSRKTLGVGATVPEAQDHLSILEIAEDEPEKPMGDFKGNEDPHDDIVVYFIESFGPVC